MALTRVLVVDDDERVGRFLHRALERQGFTVDQIIGVSGKQTGLTLYAL